MDGVARPKETLEPVGLNGSLRTAICAKSPKLLVMKYSAPPPKSNPVEEEPSTELEEMKN